MKSLMTLYREREAGLRKAVDAAPTAADAVSILLKELTWLEGVMSGDLTVPQQRALLALLEVQRAGLRGLKDGVRLEVTQRRRGFLRDLIAAFTRMFSSPATPQQTAQLGAASYRIRLDSAAYLRYFTQGLETIDRWLVDQPATPPADDRRELMEFLQQVMGDAHSGDLELLLERVEQLPQVMERYGIRYVFYDPALPSRSPEARRLFRFEASLDPSLNKVETLVPAMVQGDQVVSRGVVVEPAPTTTSAGQR